MIKINALALLFLVQFLLIFTGVSVFLFLGQKKLNMKLLRSQRENRMLESEIDGCKKEITEFSRWKGMFDDLQKKYEKISGMNIKMMETIDKLFPEAERSKEFAGLIAEMEENKKDMDSSIGALQDKNISLNEQARASEAEIAALSGKLKESVSKDELQNVLNEKMSLETKVQELEEQLDSKTKEYEKLERNFVYLEKEYNALYRDVKGENH